jgi:hypothetical protein
MPPRMQQHKIRRAKVRPPVAADQCTCGCVNRDRDSHADELVVTCIVCVASPGRRLRHAVQQVDLDESMRLSLGACR